MMNRMLLQLFMCTFLSMIPSFCYGEKTDASNLMLSKLSQEQKNLFEEYRECYYNLKQFYENAFIAATERMDVYYTTTNRERFYLPSGSPPILVYSRDYEYRSNDGKYYRLDETRSSDPSSKMRERIGIISPQQCYLLEKNTKEARYFSILAKKDELIEDGPSVYDYMFPFAAFAERGTLIEYLLFQKPFYATKCNIDDISLSEEKGEPLALITMSAVGKNGGAVEYKFEFYRNHYWALKSVAVNMNANVYITQNQYDFSNNSYPIIKNSTIVAKALDDSKRYYKKEFQITKFVPGAVPLSEFDVAQFLPPESKIGISTSSFSPFRLFCLLSGILLLSVGIFLKIRNARNNR